MPRVRKKLMNKKAIKSKEILGGKTGCLLPCSKWYIDIKEL